MTTFTLRSAAGIVSMLGILDVLGACSSDSDKGSSADAGGDAQGSGGRGTGGRGSGGRNAGGAIATGGSSGAQCTVAVATTCDGSEDCPTGERCCGRYQDQAYQEFRCAPSCVALLGDAGMGAGMAGPFWFDLCHAGDTCEDTTDPAIQCLTSTFLPGTLSRCFDTGTPPADTLNKAAGEVNCGAAVCTAGEKCCLRQPLEPYCAPASATCECSAAPPRVDGGSDAADGAPEAASPGEAGPEAAPPADAARDAPATG